MENTTIEATDPEDDGDFRVPDGNSEAAERSRRLNQAVKEAGGRAKIARLAGVQLGTLNRYLAGRDIGTAFLVPLADATGVRLEWLVSGRGPMRAGMAETPEQFRGVLARADELQAPPEVVMIPRYDVRATGGPGGLADAGKVAEYVPLPRELIRRKLGLDPANLAIIDFSGDSMFPTLQDGDSLVVNRAAHEIADGKIYVFTTGHDLMTKRLQRRVDGSLMVLSDNEMFPPETIRRSDQSPLSVFGEVVWRIGSPSLKRS